ncbi:MAG: histidine kinase dimerization/phospho-acceptor domain-containing protein [Planctomycetota bacterium]
MSPRASTPKLPATAAGRQLRRRLAVVAGVCLVAPLLGFLGLFAARQLDAQRSLSRVQAADAAEARAARSLPAAAGALSAALAERLDDPQGVWLQVDGQGELVAPRLPAPGAGPLPSPELAQALAAGDELEFVLLDGPAALLHYRALLERARPEDRAPILLELLGSYARADDWPAVEAVAQELLAGHARGAWRLGREGYLHAHLARIDAAQALGSTLDLEPALRELELTAAWEGRGFQGAGFFRERLRAAGARLTPGWTRLAEAVAAASRPLVPRDQTLRWVPGLDAWFAAQERDGGRRIGLFEPQTLLRQALALPGARAAIRDPLGRPVWTTPHPLEGEPERVLVWREPPLRGFSLELSSADEAGLERAYAQQRRALFALVALAGAVLVLATWVLLRQAGKAVDLARARTDFVAGVTHDLKTPLALIRLYGETLELHPEQDLERRKTFAGVVVREADRLHDLVENVLQLTRGEVAAPRLDATDLGATVAAAVDESGSAPAAVRGSCRSSTDCPRDPRPERGA